VTFTYWAVCDANAIVVTAPVPVPVATGEPQFVPSFDTFTWNWRGYSVGAPVVSMRNSMNVRGPPMLTWKD